MEKYNQIQYVIGKDDLKEILSLVRSVTEHRNDSEAPESPTAGGYETLLPYRHTAAAAGGRAQKK